MKIKLLFILLLSHTNYSYACKVSQEDALYVRANPTDAGEIVIGTIDYLKNSDDEYSINGTRNLIVEKRWTESPSIIKIASGTFTSCDTPNVEIKKKYLMLNKYSVKSDIKNTIEIRASSSAFIELSKAESYIDKLASIKRIPNSKPNPSWEYCREDGECIETKNICDDIVGVNKKYKLNYDNYIKNIKSNRKCVNPTVNKNTKLKCIDYFCGYEK